MTAEAPPPEKMTDLPTPLRTVLVLGVSYGGGHAVKLLASGLPEGWRVVAIDRNTHMNREYWWAMGVWLQAGTCCLVSRSVRRGSVHLVSSRFSGEGIAPFLVSPAGHLFCCCTPITPRRRQALTPRVDHPPRLQVSPCFHELTHRCLRLPALHRTSPARAQGVPTVHEHIQTATCA